ncbi:putative transcription factor B3-Domain family [Helianthus annuus]|nr:putative transcription factor B3-Domain family [Helianthus annuus]
MPMITDGWERVVKDLNLSKKTLLVFTPLGDFALELSYFVHGICGESYYTFHRYGKLGLTIIEDSLIKHCYVNNPPNSTYQICYKGSYWSVDASKFHTSYVFAKGWPEVCNDLGIQDDDLLIFRRIDNVVFELVVYRKETEIALTKKAESDNDIVFEISKAGFFENVFEDIYEDDKIASSEEGKSFSQKKLATNVEAKAVKSRKSFKFDVECTPRKRMASQLKTTEDKGKLIADRKDTVKNTTKGFHGTVHIKTSDDISCCRSADKVKCLPFEVVKRAGLSVNLHSLSVQKITRVVEVYDVKTKLNNRKPRYLMDGWRKFMSDNNLKFGDMLHFTYVASQQKIVL